MELLFPPLWTPIETVYLSTPCLKAFLDQKGYKTHQTDLSIEMWNSILSKKYMEHIGEQIDNTIDELSTSSSTDKSTVEKHNTLSVARAMLDHITPDHVEKARRTLKEKKAISPFEIRRMVGILNDATYIVSSLYHPTRVRLDAFLTRFYYDHSLPNLMSITNDEKENPFIDFYRAFNTPKRILEKADGVVGFSLGSFDQLVPSLTLATLVKRIDPSVFIVFGGAVISFMGKSLEMPPLYQLVDGFIIGEGETPLYQLVDSLDNNRSLDKVPNLIYKDSNSIRKTDTHTIEDVNALPTPSFEGLDLDAYFNSDRITPLLTTRGCYWSRCAFCSDHFTYGSKYRERDMNLVIDDIKELYDDYGVRLIAFNDLGFTARRLNLLSDAILKEGLDICWYADIRLEKEFTKAILEKAFKAGCRMVIVGLEAGSQRVLDLMEKGITVDTAVQVLRNAHDTGLWTTVYTMIGFPGETAEEARMTAEFVVQNHDIIDSDSVGVCLVEYGSKLYRDREKYGITINEDFDYRLVYYREGGEYDVSTGMSKEEVRRAKEFYDQSTMKHSLSMKFFKSVSIEEMLVWLKAYTRDDYIERFVMNYVKEQEHIDEYARVLEHKKGDAVVSLLPDVVYTQVAMRGYDGKETIQCVLLNEKKYDFANIMGSFKDFLDLCDNQRTLSDIFARLSEEYNVPKDHLMNGFLPVIEMLLKQGAFFTVH